MANYVDQINLNGNVADIMGANGDGYYPGEDLTVKFASEISGYTDVWAWIKARITAGNFSKLHIGDYIPVTCSNGTTFNAQIAGINTYKGFGSGTTIGNHIDFISTTVWPVTAKYNLVAFNNGVSSENEHPWLCSNIYHFINSLSGNVPNGTGNLPETTTVDYTESGIYYYLPDALKAVIIEKFFYLPKRFSASGLQENDTAGAWTNMGKLWLPTEFEVLGAPVFGSNKFGCSGSVKYPIFTLTPAQKKNSSWLMNSGVADSTTQVCGIDTSGRVMIFGTASNTRVPVCFRVA